MGNFSEHTWGFSGSAITGQSTLFLPDEQLVQNTVTGIVSGTRYYTIGGSGTSTSSGPAGNASASADSSTSGSAGGGTSASSAASSGIGSSGGATVACRTSSGTVDYLIGDQQKTAGLAIDASNLSVTRRYYDPYGNPAGTPPTSWPGNKGFVGGTASAATGLTNLGAREYQPQTETFITPDSIIDPYNPQSLNPYAYASDNPATESDPSGQAPYPGIGAAGNPCEQFAGMCKSEAGTATHNRDSASGGGQPVTGGCNHPHAWDFGCHVVTAGPTAPGGDVGFAAGLGDSLISAIQGAACFGPGELSCQLYQALGLPMPEAAYKKWVASKGVDTASSSTYGGGQIIGTLFILVGGGAVGEAGTIDAAAEEGAANPLDMIPEGASRRVLTPDPKGGAQEGVEFKWTNEQSQTVRLRIHGPDGTAPPGSNAAEGPIYRVQVGGRYMDAEGNLYPRGVYNPNSPYYDPEAANATHIPWPPGIPLPW